MGEFVDGIGYSEWSDWDSTADVVIYKKAVTIPNGGEVRLDVEYEGISMEDSGIWFLGIVNGVQQNLACGDYVTGQGNIGAYDVPSSPTSRPTRARTRARTSPTGPGTRSSRPTWVRP